MAHSGAFSRLSHILTRRLSAASAGAVQAVQGTAGAEPESRAEPRAAAPRALSRRHWLTATGAGAAAASLSACGLDDEGVNFEVVVVGAGAAGLHCAWRLRQAGMSMRVFEASTRVGGRMLTSRNGHPESSLGELGGELIDSNHAALWCLVDELGLTLDDRTTPATATTEVWWVGGVRVPEATIVEQFSAVAPAFADAVEAADTDDDAYAQLDLMTLAEWLDQEVPSATYPELHAVLTSAYRGEFGRETAEQSALNLLYLIGSDDPDPFRIFGESDERWHVHEGTDAIATGMAERLDDDDIALAHRLTALRQDGGTYVLTFSSPEGNVFVRARKVVLAIPWTVLRGVSLERSGLSEDKRALISTLGYGANAKVMGWFNAPIWRVDHDCSGALTGDDATQQGWDSAIGQGVSVGIFTNYLGGEIAETLSAQSAEDWYEATTLATLESVWPGSTAAYIQGSVTPMMWANAPYALGSYTCYLPGQWATWATEGEAEGGVHFCGEHCSPDFQGWMEGAVETGGLVAAAILDEYGRDLPAGLECLVTAKLVVEQPSYRALTQRPRWRARRRALHLVACELRAAWRGADRPKRR